MPTGNLPTYTFQTLPPGAYRAPVITTSTDAVCDYLSELHGMQYGCYGGTPVMPVCEFRPVPPIRYGTRVVFRKFRNGQVIALFPGEHWDTRGNIASHQHIGQHGGASPDLIRELQPATASEYADLGIN